MKQHSLLGDVRKRTKLTRHSVTGRRVDRRNRNLRLEHLEDRRVLATFFVNGDVGSDANPGTAAMPFATIQRGIDEASSVSGDDTVEVAPALGGYSENLSIADSSGTLTLRGSTGTATDVLVSGGGSDVVTASLANNVTLDSIHFRDGGVGILVTGGPADLVVDNVSSTNHSAGGLVVRSAGDLTVRDTVITGANFGMFLENFDDLLVESTNSSVNRADGIFASRGNTVTVRTSILDDNRSEGISVFNVPLVALEATSLSGNGDNGAQIGNAGDVTMSDLSVVASGVTFNASGVFANNVNSVAIAGGDYSNNQFDGISVFNVATTVTMTDVKAIGNRLRGVRLGGQQATSGADSVTIEGGEFTGHAWHGIDIANARQSVSVSDVRAADNGQNGLLIAGGTAAPATISGGTYSGNVFHGINLDDVGGATIRRVEATGNGSNTVSDGTGGGGISIRTGSSEPILIEEVNISENLSRRDGGGLEIFAALSSATPTVTVRNSTIADNSNQFAQLTGGGGIAVTNAGLSITGSTISGNETGVRGGGGLLLVSAETEIVNSTISENEAPFSSGGGIFLRNGSADLEITNTTISHNVAGTGGGVYRASGAVAPLNTIIAENTASGSAPDYFGFVSSLGNNLVGDASGVIGPGFAAPGDQAGTSGSPIDPLLGPLQDNGGPTETRELLDGSPAINAGNNAGAPATDQRGVARPQGAVADIGAFEKILNQPPVANDDTAETDEDVPVTIDATANDTDPDGNLDPTTAALVSGPSNGTVLNNGDGTFTYSPALHFNGSDSFTYEVCDTGGLCDTAVVTIRVYSVVDAVIDVKPGKGDEVVPINLGSNGRTPIAILTTSTSDGEIEDFDATTVDISTIKINGVDVDPAKVGFEDVDGDEDVDLLLHFWTEDLANILMPEDVLLELSAEVDGGEATGPDLRGSDAIRIVPGGSGRRK